MHEDPASGDTARLSVPELARMIDLSAVTAAHNEADVRRLAQLAREKQCVAAFALPGLTPLLGELLEGEPAIALGGVVGFPSGGTLTAHKAIEARELARLGCRELDMVINIGWLRSGWEAQVRDDIRAVVEAAEGRPVKVILECHYLSEDEIRRGCALCVEAGASFVKTGTGWAPTGATAANIALMKACVGDACQVKAAGGVRTLETLVELHRLGATRFGIGVDSAIRIFEQCAALPGGVVNSAGHTRG